jgi:hypothetical protein
VYGRRRGRRSLLGCEEGVGWDHEDDVGVGSLIDDIYFNNSKDATYDHRTLRTELPVRSAELKQCTGGLVVRWVTTGEYPLLYVFDDLFCSCRSDYASGKSVCLFFCTSRGREMGSLAWHGRGVQVLRAGWSMGWVLRC